MFKQSHKAFRTPTDSAWSYWPESCRLDPSDQPHENKRIAPGNDVQAFYYDQFPRRVKRNAVKISHLNATSWWVTTTTPSPHQRSSNSGRATPAVLRRQAPRKLSPPFSRYYRFFVGFDRTTSATQPNQLYTAEGPDFSLRGHWSQPYRL
jgi:hypothetical protein